MHVTAEMNGYSASVTDRWIEDVYIYVDRTDSIICIRENIIIQYKCCSGFSTLEIIILKRFYDL
jgi:hypothetical protein